MTILGTAPGSLGAMALISDHDGRILTKCGIPKKSGMNEVDTAQLLHFLNKWNVRPLVVLEQAPHHAPSTSAVRSLALNIGIITGCLESRGITVVRPLSQRWQKELLGKVERGGSKEAAEKFALSRWPAEKWHTKRGRLDDGAIDAACLAEWGRTKL
jgi:hypothetical protein